jgi:hypothetical protein
MDKSTLRDLCNLYYPEVKIDGLGTEVSTWIHTPNDAELKNSYKRRRTILFIF